MRNKLFFLCLFLCPFFLRAQIWEKLGEINRPALSFFEDADQDKFYVGGSFGYFNNDTLRSIFCWDGENAFPVGCGFNWDCQTPFNVLAEVQIFVELLNIIMKFTQRGILIIVL